MKPAGAAGPPYFDTHTHTHAFGRETKPASYLPLLRGIGLAQAARERRGVRLKQHMDVGQN